ncbi:MAG: HAD-IIA family hydrolase [Deltaproteobacteria bacterium]|nr:HAD-IIA family hydrolase [Deltaproteobacteria bacterium]
MGQPLAGKRLFVLDMDGTIYLGDRLFPWTLPFLRRVREVGGQHLFLTNNSSKTSRTYVEKLRQLGVDASSRDVLTSGDATIELLRSDGKYRKLFLLATPEVESEFAAGGFELVRVEMGSGAAGTGRSSTTGPTVARPDAAVLTFDMTLTYGKLRTFCRFLRDGVPFIATHPDINCPTPEGPIPDIGAFMALVESSTGRKPDRVVGKPSPDFLKAAMLRKGATAAQTVMIGDRLYTDVACGLAAGVTTVLVLSGESTREMAEASGHKPDLTVENLGELIPLL